MQTSWADIHVTSEPFSRNNKCRLNVRIAKRMASVFPDAVLCRNEVTSPTADYRNQLYGLMMGGAPSINSLHSIFCFCEKAVVTSELFRLNREMGPHFPVIPMTYFSSYLDMMYTQEFPCVVKIGSAHAGM